MNRTTRFGAVAVGATVIALSALSVAQASAQTSAPARAGQGSSSQVTITAAREEQAVLGLLAAYSTGDQSAFDIIDPHKFIQHDPQIGDGLAGLKAWLASIPPGQISVKPVRVLADGPYVAVHSETTLPSGDTTSWDIFRFERGKIVEHWDTRQPIAPPNGVGHTELDGPTTVTDRAAAEFNKSLAWTAITTVFVDGDISLYGEPLWNAAGYIQHSEGINADGIAGSKPIIGQLLASGNLVYGKIDKIIGDGNFVLAISQGSLFGAPYSFYDLFRMARGQIQEHWDVLQPLTPPDQAKNTNGQVNFPPDPPTAPTSLPAPAYLSISSRNRHVPRRGRPAGGDPTGQPHDRNARPGARADPVRPLRRLRRRQEPYGMRRDARRKSPWPGYPRESRPRHAQPR
jgi:predicted SnoaL-like aldol condensation-catalyzing enzyme